MDFNERKAKAKKWWDKNKKTVFIVTGVTIAAIGGYCAYRKFSIPRSCKLGAYKATCCHSMLSTPSTISTVVAAQDNSLLSTPSVKVLNNGVPFSVSGHTRNCPVGKHPSAEKLAFAAEKGIVLAPNQTFVNPYMKNIA